MTKKKQIMKVATKLLARKGYKDTSMAELAKITGVAQGTIFYHYNSKEELFLAILEDFKTEILKEFEEYLAQRSFNSGLKMMNEIVGFYLFLAGKMEDRFLLLHRHDAYELARVNPVGRDYLESIYTCFVDIFEKAIVTGQKDGSVAQLPARRTALIIFTMVDGLVRLNTYNLYDAAALYDDLITSISRILMNFQPSA
ncbi:MAG: TetR/AcrR family transcriptional regulator [Desulfobacterales bacterium]|jgi:AcrR family transcriptional regulator